jgi:hypothetical protein
MQYYTGKLVAIVANPDSATPEKVDVIMNVLRINLNGNRGPILFTDDESAQQWMKSKLKPWQIAKAFLTVATGKDQVIKFLKDLMASGDTNVAVDAGPNQIGWNDIPSFIQAVDLLG